MSRNKNPTLHVQDLRAKIATLQTERETLLDQKRSRPEVAAFLAAQVEGWARSGITHITAELQKLTHGNPSQPLTVRVVSPMLTGASVTQSNVNLGPLLVALVGADKVTAVFAAALEQMPEGLPKAVRIARVTEIDIELDRLETEEETLVYESRGELERRPDARPEIVLGMVT